MQWLRYNFLYRGYRYRAFIQKTTTAVLEGTGSGGGGGGGGGERELLLSKSMVKLLDTKGSLDILKRSFINILMFFFTNA